MVSTRLPNALISADWTALQREDVYKHFKFTSRTAVISILGLLVFPASIYWVAASTDVRSAKTIHIWDICSLE